MQSIVPVCPAAGAPERDPNGAAGFTLIEILVVIGIIGLIAAAFAPSLFGAGQNAKIAETQARILQIGTFIDGSKEVWGDVPPDDYSLLGGAGGAQSGWQFGPDDGRNTGVESLLLHLSWQTKGGGRFDESRGQWLKNTDGDKAPVTIPLLGHKERMEILDAWGTPFAYFSAKTGSGYRGAQRIVTTDADGNAAEEVEARPWKDPASGAWFNPRSCQIVSAGPDRLFNTDDDIANFEVPRN
jgi:prepilin-type N-terminal cleavage/methylation domain-containing protein